jgi:hypothetical protein
MTDNALDQQLQRLRQQYRRGDWQSQYTAINRALTAADAQVIPITGEDYPPQLQQIAEATTTTVSARLSRISASTAAGGSRQSPYDQRR